MKTYYNVTLDSKTVVQTSDTLEAAIAGVDRREKKYDHMAGRYGITKVVETVLKPVMKVTWEDA